MAAQGRSNQVAVQEGNHCSKSHPRCTAPALCLAAASTDNDLNWSECHFSSSFPTSNPACDSISKEATEAKDTSAAGGDSYELGPPFLLQLSYLLYGH